MRWPAVDVMVQQRRLEVVVLWKLFEEFLKLRNSVEEIRSKRVEAA